MPGALKCGSANACAEVQVLVSACAYGVELIKLENEQTRNP